MGEMEIRGASKTAENKVTKIFLPLWVEADREKRALYRQ